jgi:hypothetical protein
MMAEAVVGVAGAIFGAGTETFVIRTFDQRRNAAIGRRRWRRRSIVVGVRRATSRQETGCSDERQCNTREFHSVLTVRFARDD